MPQNSSPKQSCITKYLYEGFAHATTKPHKTFTKNSKKHSATRERKAKTNKHISAPQKYRNSNYLTCEF